MNQTNDPHPAERPHHANEADGSQVAGIHCRSGIHQGHDLKDGLREGHHDNPEIKVVPNLLSAKEEGLRTIGQQLQNNFHHVGTNDDKIHDAKPTRHFALWQPRGHVHLNAQQQQIQHDEAHHTIDKASG
eukprot:Skav202337  [mRNA]  locus=scaffold781:198373:203629:- [translate_table: standard]